MGTQQENVREKFDVDEHLIEKVWTDDLKGLRKEVISFSYCTVTKASELSKCSIEIHEIRNLGNHKTNYLLLENIGKELYVEIGNSTTPVDCYIEEFLKQMLTNETSKCSITTKSSGVITFIMKLKGIEFGGYFCEQSPSSMFDLAKRFKENGVMMFKDFPLFAHNYFNLAAKCLLSMSLVENFDGGLKKKDFEELLQNVNLNIAACLLKQHRYDDILHVLSFCTLQENPSEKAVYRLASAYFRLKQFESAKNTIERIDYKNNKELVQLLAKVCENWKVDEHKYSNMVKKMFK